MKMSMDVQKAVAECGPGLIATASKSGKPNVSAKGSLQVVDDEHVAFCDIRSPRTIANLKENPQVSILCLRPDRKGCRIWGKAEILTEGDAFDQFAQAYTARNMKVNHLVVVDVDEAIAF